MRILVALTIVLAGCAGPAIDTAEPIASRAVTGLLCGQDAPLACNVLVDGPSANEYSVAVDPTDPLTAVVTANDYEGGTVDVAGFPYQHHMLWGSIWTTHDGGASWAHQYVPGRLDEPGSPLWGQEYVGDLVVIFDDAGTAHIAGIGYGGTGPARHKLFVMSSSDGDAWTEPVIVDAPAAGLEFHDKPALLATSTGRLVLVWNYGGGYPPREPLENEADDMRWAVSDDGGKTWLAGQFDDAGSGISASLAEAPDGTIHATYRTYSPLGVMHRSSSDGTDWGPETTVVQLGSPDTATTNANYRTFALPDLTITPDGRLHSIIADKDGQGHGEILVSTSDDAGATWTTSRIDGGDEASGRFLAAIDSHNGTLVAAWLDRRDDPADASYDLWMATNTGDGWREQKVSAAPSPPGEAYFIGDYIEVSVHGAGVYVAWPDLRHGNVDLYVAHLRLGPLPDSS